MFSPKDFNLPVFPWDTLDQIKAVAASHPGGVIDLSIGTPVDPVSPVARDALIHGANYPGYPPGVGSPQLLQAITQWFFQARGVKLSTSALLPTVGSKELVASLALQLGLGPGHIIGFPEVSYPTYEVGARLAGCGVLRLGKNVASWPQGAQAPALVWLNSPGNPDGSVLSVSQLREIVLWARENSVILVCDECYALLFYGQDPAPSLLDPRVTQGNNEGLLVAHSLSKQANMAGYRAAFVAGDEKLVAHLREIRKHWGLMIPGPVQEAMVAALTDTELVETQRKRYSRRREVLLRAVTQWGLVNSKECVAGLYLWLHAPRKEEYSGRDLALAFAREGILVAPGDFYGPGGQNYVRIGLTGSDEQIASLASRLADSPGFNKKA